MEALVLVVRFGIFDGRWEQRKFRELFFRAVRRERQRIQSLVETHEEKEDNGIVVIIKDGFKTAVENTF